MCNLSVGLIRRGENRGIAIGEARGITIGEARGITIGEARGEARGVEKGITEGKITMARTLYAEGIPLETIARSADVPVEVVERWLELT